MSAACTNRTDYVSVFVRAAAVGPLARAGVCGTLISCHPDVRARPWHKLHGGAHTALTRRRKSVSETHCTDPCTAARHALARQVVATGPAPIFRPSARRPPRPRSASPAVRRPPIRECIRTNGHSTRARGLRAPPRPSPRRRRTPRAARPRHRPRPRRPRARPPAPAPSPSSPASNCDRRIQKHKHETAHLDRVPVHGDGRAVVLEFFNCLRPLHCRQVLRAVPENRYAYT